MSRRRFRRRSVRTAVLSAAVIRVSACAAGKVTLCTLKTTASANFVTSGRLGQSRALLCAWTLNSVTHESCRPTNLLALKSTGASGQSYARATISRSAISAAQRATPSAQSLPLSQLTQSRQGTYTNYHSSRSLTATKVVAAVLVSKPQQP